MPPPHRSDVSSKHTPAVHLWVPAAEAIAAENARVFERGAHGNHGFAGGFHGDPSEIGSVIGFLATGSQRGSWAALPPREEPLSTAAWALHWRIRRSTRSVAIILVEVFTAEFFASSHAAFGVLDADDQSGDAPGHDGLLHRRRIDQLQQLIHDVAETPGLLAAAIGARRIEHERPLRDAASPLGMPAPPAIPGFRLPAAAGT